MNIGSNGIFIFLFFFNQIKIHKFSPFFCVYFLRTINTEECKKKFLKKRKKTRKIATNFIAQKRKKNKKFSFFRHFSPKNKTFSKDKNNEIFSACCCHNA